MVKVTKNGSDFFEIEDSEDSLEAARRKGYRPIMTVTKNGKDVFDLDADDVESVRAAFDKGYMDVNAYQNLQAQPKREYSKTTSALQGAAESMSMGFDDEIGGAATSIAKNLGAYAGLSDPTTYEAERDKIRESKESLREANPGSYLTGGLAAGLATPGGIAAKAGSGLGKRVAVGAGVGALQGGLQGYGNSDDESLVGQLEDTALAAGIGAILGGGAGAITKARVPSKDSLREISGEVKGITSVAREGFKEGARSIDDIGYGTGVLKTGAGLKSAAKAVLDRNKNKAEFKDMISEFRKHIGPGSRHDYSDEDVVTMLLMEDGENLAKRWLADSASTVSGGGVPREDYLNLLNKSPETTKAQRLFSKQDAGEDLVENVRKAYGDLSAASGAKYDALKGQARANFEQLGNEPVKILSDAMAYVQKRKGISNSVNNQLSDIFNDMVGEGPQGFSKLDPTEQFDRILAARQAVGKAVKWAGKNEPPEAQRVLQDVYHNLGGFLKKFDSMQEADAGYSAFKNIEDSVFKPIAEVRQGKITDFDPIKLEKIFGQSDSGRRLLKSLEKAKEKLATGRLDEGEAKKLTELIASIEGLVETSSGKRALEGFRQKTAGPTGPAVERLGAGIRQDSMLDSAIRTPHSFLQMRENVADVAQEAFGKPYSKLAENEKMAVIQYSAWLLKHAKAAPAERKRAWEAAMKGSGL